MDLDIYFLAHRAWIDGAATCAINMARDAPVKFQLAPAGKAIAQKMANKKIQCKAQLCLSIACKALEVALRNGLGIAERYVEIKAEIAGGHFRPKIIGTWRGARVA